MIRVSEPCMRGNERTYVDQALAANQLSGGRFVDRFESAFASFTGSKYAVATTSGTTALHLALAALGIGPGDEVILPSLTYVATANAVLYCGATPIFVDIDAKYWCLDPVLVEKALTDATRAILAVDYLGHPANLGPLSDLASRSGVALVQDAAQAHGAKYKGKPLSAFGDACTYSFFGNKILATGEGGAVVTNRRELAERLKFLSGTAVDPERRYFHTELGFNYRLGELAGAIGLAQVEDADWHTSRRRDVAAWYRDVIGSFPNVTMQPEAHYAQSAYWMVGVTLDGYSADERDAVIAHLRASGIETRPFFYPLHQLPHLATGQRLPITERVAASGLMLPTHANLSKRDVLDVVAALRAAVWQRRAA